MLVWALAVTLAQPLTFDEALALAERNPVVQAQAEGVEARRSLAESVPWLVANPSVMVQPGWRRLQTGGTGPELYLGVTQDVSLAGAGRSRRETALKESAADGLELAIRRRILRLGTAQAWLALWAAQGALEAARREHTLIVDLHEKVARGAAAGGFTKVDVAVTRAYVAEAHLAELSLEGEVFSRGIALNRVLGRDDDDTLVAGALPDIRLADVAPSEVLDAASRSSVVGAAAALTEATKAHGVELEAQRGTSLQVGALGWREGGGDLAAVGTLQLTLPVFERAQRERSANAAAQAQAQGRERAALVEERLERRDALHEVEHTAEVRKAVEDELLPAATDSADGIERRFAAGEATAQDVVMARRTLVATTARRIRARADEVFARFRLAVLSEEARR